MLMAVATDTSGEHGDQCCGSGYGKQSDSSDQRGERDGGDGIECDPVNWSTDSAADSQVAYGTTTPMGRRALWWSTLTTTLGESDGVEQQDLSLQVLSQDAQGNLASSARSIRRVGRHQ